MSWTVSRRNEESAGCGFLVQRRRGVVGTFHLDFFRGKNKKTISLLLSAVLALMVFLPYLPPLQLEAAENDNLVTLTTAHGDFGGDHRLYCIDKGGLAIWGIADDGDQYQKHSVSSMRIPLSEKEQEYTDLFANPYQAASYGYIDDVIEPRNTRFRICRGLAQLANKRQNLPAKKHGCMPM